MLKGARDTGAANGAVPVFADPPSDPQWQLGGTGYGLEPLTMPPPYPSALSPGPAGDFSAEHRRLRQLCDLPVGGTEDDPEDDRVPWFRWITGHQVSFIVWRLMAETQDAATTGRLPVPEAVRGLVDYVRAYAAMVLYTGSCSRETYHRVIRPSLRLHHPAFSGAWAPDYAAVRGLFRGGRPGSPGVMTPVN